MDPPSWMSPFVCRLHPFPDGVVSSSSTGLEDIARALAARNASEATATTTAATATASTTDTNTPGGEAAAAMWGATEVWQAAERLVEGSAGEGASSSRTAASLLAGLSHLRAALRRCTSGGGSGGGIDGTGGGGRVCGAWEALSAGPKGAVLARAAVGAVVLACRSERPAAVHLEATRLAGEVRSRGRQGEKGAVFFFWRMIG